MTAHLLVSGKLVRRPELKTSKSGKPYAVASIVDRGGDGGSSRYFSVVSFSESCIAELSRLDVDDVVAVQGAFALEEFEGRDGSRRTALKVIADHMLALRKPPKSRAAKPERSE